MRMRILPSLSLLPDFMIFQVKPGIQILMGNLPTLHTWGAETKIYKKKSMSKMTWSASQVQAVRPAKEARPGARVHLPGTLSPGLGQGEAGSVLVPWGCPGVQGPWPPGKWPGPAGAWNCSVCSVHPSLAHL